jgi:hypothetical protein
MNVGISKYLTEYKTLSDYIDPEDAAHVYTAENLKTSEFTDAERRSKQLHDFCDDAKLTQVQRAGLVNYVNYQSALSAGHGRSFIKLLHHEPFRKRMREKTFLTPHEYHACVNNCKLYEEATAETDTRCGCKEHRFFPGSNVPKATSKIYSVSDLMAFNLTKPDFRNSIKYRANYRHVRGKYQDVFDGSRYQNMLKDKDLWIDDNTIFFGLYIDSFEPEQGAKDNKFTMLHLINFNLPPEER